MNKTSIEWTDFTWNPVRARNKTGGRTGTFCTKISPGCKNCYASVINRRFGTGEEYEVPNLAHHEFFLDTKILGEPLQRKKPARIFVGDMFDLWHEAIPSELIAEVLRVALKTPRHTFQFLTKRAERMMQTVNFAQKHWGVKFGSHMHFGVSVEDQARADQRIPFLLETECALRFLSVEPMLESVEIYSYMRPSFAVSGMRAPRDETFINIMSEMSKAAYKYAGGSLVDWVICGGESGPGARPFNLAWAESLLQQCRTAGVPFFMKQVGNRAFCSEPCANQEPPFCGTWKLKNRKGGDPSEWPEHLRVRELPQRATEAA